MEQRRLILIVALMIVGFFLYQAWNQEHPSTPPAVATSATQTPSAQPALEFPTAAQSEASSKHLTSLATQAANSAQLVTVNTDVMTAKIDLRGGTVVFASLTKFPEDINNPNTPVVLFNDNPAFRYLAQSALVPQGQTKLTELPLFTAQQMSYELKEGQSELTVVLKRQMEEGVQITKVFTFKPGEYVVNVAYTVNNESAAPFEAHLYQQLIRSGTPLDKSGSFGVSAYFGAALSTENSPYQKISFKDMGKKNVDATSVGGWIAMQQHYFLSAWIPSQSETNQYYTRALGDNLYTLGSMSPLIQVNSGQSKTITNQLYVGPVTSRAALNTIVPHLGATMDYGWFWFISEPILWIMQQIYSVVGNWGIAIILVTLLIKVVFYYPSAKSYRSMANMRKLQPKMEAIKERFGDDKQKLSQATMELYRKEKVNPLGGCLPMLIQIPFFIALYWVLIESVELRQAPFYFWIHDLSVKDPLHILPLIMGITMFIQQKLNPPPPDPTQAKVFMFLPVIFTVLFWNFPAGLVLYWITNNSLSILQQWYIMRQFDKKDARVPQKNKVVKS